MSTLEQTRNFWVLRVEEVVVEAVYQIQDNRMSICHHQGMCWEPRESHGGTPSCLSSSYYLNKEHRASQL